MKSQASSSRNPVAKNLHKACKPFVVPHKHVSKREAIHAKEARENAAESVLGGFADGFTEGFTDDCCMCNDMCDIGCSNLTVED